MNEKQRIQQIIDSRDDLTVRNVALKAGLSDSLLNKFLANEDQSMTIKNLRKIAQAMDVSLRWILFGDDSEIADLWEQIPKPARKQAHAVLKALASDHSGS